MNVDERLQEVFDSVFGEGQVELTDETTAADVERWDSVAHISLMVGIEQAFGVQFVGNQLAEFQNVGELKRFLGEKLAR